MQRMTIRTTFQNIIEGNLIYMKFLQSGSWLSVGFPFRMKHQSIALVFIFLASVATADGQATRPSVLAGDRDLAPLDTFQDCNVCPEMVVLPLGSFIMGAPLEQSEYLYLLWNKPKEGEPRGLQQEGPEHEVTIDIPIAIGRNEVTRAEWMACVSFGGCSHVPDPKILTWGGGHVIADDPRDPVFNLTYLDMQEYVQWLNRALSVDAYRLPTEAEWEYAARAGTRTKFAQGETLTKDQAHFSQFNRENGRSIRDPNNPTKPVRVDELDAANAWGLRHMAGNLGELTMSCWSASHLGLSTSSAYLAAAKSVSSCRRVAKGGSFNASAEYARPANRGSVSEVGRPYTEGFRVVRELLGKEK